jgi:hypothetical protein
MEDFMVLMARIGLEWTVDGECIEKMQHSEAQPENGSTVIS